MNAGNRGGLLQTISKNLAAAVDMKMHRRLNQQMKIFLVAILVGVLTQTVSARFITLLGRTQNGTNYFDSLSIGTNEVVEVRSLYEHAFSPQYGPPTANLVIQRLGQTLTIRSILFLDATNAMRLPLLVAGPATLTLENESAAPAMATLEVKRESFPPDKTLIVPGDSNGANVIMESSTDLVNWSAAVPGPYTNRTNNLFFRIRAERVP